jgi:GH15 family glucan-1,4-alpha-glucosidase
LARDLEKNATLADEYDELADKVHESINSMLYDKEKHYYYISTDRKTGIAQDLNAMAILYGVAPMADRQAILDTMDAALIDESKPGKYLAYSYDAYGYPHKAVPYSAVSFRPDIESSSMANHLIICLSTTMPLPLSKFATPVSEWISSTAFGLR